MFTPHEIEQMLFLDIETASSVASFENLSERMQELWIKKTEQLTRFRDETPEPADFFRERAAIYSEFGKVITISCAYLRFEGDRATFHVKSCYGPDEKQNLTEFAAVLNSFMTNPGRSLCAHNGKEFDFPYLGRRYLVNGLPLPDALKLQGKKPWETPYVDTMELWKFGDYKSYTSLDLLTAIMEIPTPKDDIDGSEVGRVFWEDEDHDRIKDYCEKDVLATAQVVLKFSGLPLIEPARVVNK